jgi:transcription-repair coupling factor (superfamily II helicase)
MEHWLPLFHEHLDTLFDYLGGAPLVFDPAGARTPPRERISPDRRTITRPARGAEARRAARRAVYKPLPPDALYLTPNELEGAARRPPRGAADALRAARIGRARP